MTDKHNIEVSCRTCVRDPDRSDACGTCTLNPLPIRINKWLPRPSLKIKLEDNGDTTEEHF